MSAFVRRCLSLLLIPLLAAACSTGPPGAGAIAVSVPYDLDTLDPHAKNTLSNFAIVCHFYDPLVTTDAELRIRPALARLWETPDASTWIFHLRSGVAFADGRPLRARDVVYSIRRLQTTPALEIAAYVLYIRDVEAVGPLTVRIRTEQPLSILLNKLRFVAIVPEGATAESLRRRPNGTGPYRLAAWEPDSLRVVRREGYWGTPPGIENVTFRLDRMPDEAAQDLIAGRSQLVQCSSRRAEGLVKDSGRFETARRFSIFTKYLGWDLYRDRTPYVAAARNPFHDPRVRRAVNAALDREALVARLSTIAVPATQLVPPPIFGFNPTIPAPVHDRALARRLLAQAGFPSGFSGTLHARRMFGEAAQLVRDQLRYVGVALEVEEMDDPEFLDAARRKAFSLHVSRFGCLTGDASDIYDVTLHTTDEARGVGVSNFGGYSSPELDRAIEESAGIENVADRRAALEAIMARAMEELPWLPLYFDQDVYAFDRGLDWQPRNDSLLLAAEIKRKTARR